MANLILEGAKVLLPVVIHTCTHTHTQPVMEWYQDRFPTGKAGRLVKWDLLLMSRSRTEGNNILRAVATPTIHYHLTG
jgi:hypothetical protein